MTLSCVNRVVCVNACAPSVLQAQKWDEGVDPGAHLPPTIRALSSDKVSTYFLLHVLKVCGIIFYMENI